MMRPARTKPAPGRPARFGSVPREIRLTANGKALMVTAIVLAAAAIGVAIVLSIVRVRQMAEREFRARDGVAVEAAITRVTRTRGDQPRTDITYRYSTAGGEYEASARLSKRARPVAEGDRIGIVYLRSQPSRSWLAGREPGMVPLLVIPAIALALLTVAAILAAHLQRVRRLMSEGRFAQARIIETKKVKGEHGTTYRVQYEFSTITGKTMHATAQLAKPPTVGDTVPVIYHRDDPNWNALYPLSLVIPARPSAGPGPLGSGL